MADRQDGRTLEVAALNERRRRAVTLRLEGMRVADVAARAELSVPTVIAAHRAFVSGGWDAVNVKTRGRKTGSTVALDAAATDRLIASICAAGPEHYGLPQPLWGREAARELAARLGGNAIAPSTMQRYLAEWGFAALGRRERPEANRSLQSRRTEALREQAVDEGAEVWTVGATPATLILADRYRAPAADRILLWATGPRRRIHWLASARPLAVAALIDFFERLQSMTGHPVLLLGEDMDISRVAEVQQWLAARTGQVKFHSAMQITMPPNPSPNKQQTRSTKPSQRRAATPKTDEASVAKPAHNPSGEKHLMSYSIPSSSLQKGAPAIPLPGESLTHLQRLEAESIQIMREVAAEATNPVMLYSIGKDSAVMLHLATKAFYPAKPPFPLLHVDTTWKFREMYEFRDRMAHELGFDLLVHVNPEGMEMDINPFTHGSAIHTDIMKTQGLKQALDKYGFDAAFGGARRDEEKSRAKERIFSFRSAQHHWDPKNQRPELWHIYNTRKHSGESIRVFPLSNWTELDVWQYIHLENIPIVPLYYAKPRPVVERNGTLIMVDDDRMPLQPGEVPMMRSVRFRTLGCYPLTGAVESTAATLPAIIQEMLLTRTSERQGRVIDHDQAASMEKKKQEGYF